MKETTSKPTSKPPTRSITDYFSKLPSSSEPSSSKIASSSKATTAKRVHASTPASSTAETSTSVERPHRAPARNRGSNGKKPENSSMSKWKEKENVLTRTGTPVGGTKRKLAEVEAERFALSESMVSRKKSRSISGDEDRRERTEGTLEPSLSAEVAGRKKFRAVIQS
ncbi:hypothetical protein BT69DRAFT_274870 [Atractiella rhizophila]|nr:hypothetical protein BT69DRAFT_274870 [Atractiella rhizophila]